MHGDYTEQKTTPSNYVERVAILCFHYSVKSITQVRYISNTTYKMQFFYLAIIAIQIDNACFVCAWLDCCCITNPHGLVFKMEDLFFSLPFHGYLPCVSAKQEEQLISFTLRIDSHHPYTLMLKGIGLTDCPAFVVKQSVQPLFRRHRHYSQP